MNDEETIKLDTATMRRAADGTITISPKRGGGCVNIGLIIATGIVALLASLMTLNGAIQFFMPAGKFDLGIVLFGLFVIVVFGGYSYYLYSKMRYGQKLELITITPTLNIIKIDDRTIPFNHVTDISVEETPAIIEGAGVAIFQLVLSEGKIAELGRITVETQKLDERRAEIITFLKVALKKN